MSQTELSAHIKVLDFDHTQITVSAPHHAPWGKPCPSNQEYDWNVGVLAITIARKLGCRLVVADRLREHTDPNKYSAGEVYDHYLQVCTGNLRKAVVEIHGMSSKYRFLLVASAGRATCTVTMHELRSFTQAVADRFNQGDPKDTLITTRGKNPEPTIVFYHENEGFTLDAELNKMKEHVVARNTSSLIDFDRQGIRPLHLEVEERFRKPPNVTDNLWKRLKTIDPKAYQDDDLPNVLAHCGELPSLGKRLVDALVPAIRRFANPNNRGI